ncbi:MAG: alpha/beta hydrolase [Caulobacteraceae bacterium]
MMLRTKLAGLSVAAILATAGLAAAQSAAQQPPAAPAVRIDDDGAVHAPAMVVPPSSFLSPEGKAYLGQHLKDMQNPSVLGQKDGVPTFMQGYLARQKALFAVDRRDETIAGVHAFIYRPRAGVAPRNQRRVLINLHGGGFSGCFPGCAELESMPVAALGRIEVISLDYREGPQYRFPAASEDVAAVYRQLLKRYPPRNIGIYGCSAGGMLTGMSVAWFQRHGLPRPGAVGIFCAGATLAQNGFGGDAAYTAAPLGEARPAPPPPSPTASPTPAAEGPPLGYLAGTDAKNPLVAPAASADVLRKFPPTLIITATRGFEMSSAIYTHSQLVKQGVDAELHVWEGLFHGFFYNPDVPESREAYDVMVKFFDRHLGR